MKYLKLSISAFLLVSMAGCLNGKNSSESASSEMTECEQARDKASKSKNGAKVLFCDGFNQAAGKLSSTSANWMDQN